MTAAVRVAVVVPLYNKRASAERALDSLLDQHYGLWRAVIVDDGSTDGSASIAHKYAGRDARITVITQANAGPGPARNRGMAAAQDVDFYAFLDADDEWRPDYLGSCVAFLEARPECGAVSTSWEHDVVESPPTSGATREVSAFTLRSNQAVKDALDGLHSSASVVRAPTAREVGGFFDGYRCTFGEDNWFWLQVAARGPVGRIEEPLIVFHLDHGELGFARRDAHPAAPALVRARQLLAALPSDVRPRAAEYLAWFGAFTLRRRAHQVGLGAALRAMREEIPETVALAGPRGRARMVAWTLVGAGMRALRR